MRGSRRSLGSWWVAIELAMGVAVVWATATAVETQPDTGRAPIRHRRVMAGTDRPARHHVGRGSGDNQLAWDLDTSVSPLPETDWLSVAGHGVFTHFLDGLQNQFGRNSLGMNTVRSTLLMSSPGRLLFHLAQRKQC